MGRKRDRPQPQVDEQQQEEEQTPSPSSMPPKTKKGRSQPQVDEDQQQDEEQLKLADEQQQDEQDGDGDESDTDSKDNSQIVKESNKSSAKTKTDEQEKPVSVVAEDEEEKAVAVVAEEDEKKPPIISNRLWSSDDEIIVLQSVIDFKDEFNKDAAANGDAFFHFVKDKFHYTNFSKSQVMDKLRKLKNKYKKSSAKDKDKDPRSSNPHDLKSYELSNTIWGNLDANNKAAASSDHVKTEERVDDENKGRVEKDVLKPEEEENDFRRLYPHLIGGGFEGETSLHSVTLLDGCKPYLGNVDRKLLEEWDENWRKVRIAEITAYLSRLALIQEQTTWFRNHMKSS